MPKKIVIVGAGPVGSLAAVYAAKRGFDVEVYELRDDIRKSETAPLNFTKSINLALSERGINGLRSAGNEKLLEEVLSQTIPMHGRMVHTKSVTGALTEQSQAYDVHGRFQRSVDRGLLNISLLNELDRLPQVKVHFLHKLTGADFRKRKAWFEDRSSNSSSKDSSSPSDSSARPNEFVIDFDLMLGCDGAHSAVRYHMMKFARTNYTQEYIDCLWSEFSMPPTPSGGFAISENHLHIWPAGDSMFIALPNLDKSFVCTLFGPSSLFSDLESASTEEDLVAHFTSHFPGVVPDLISRSDLHAQFQRNPHLPLINIKCTPHHYGSSVAILGDAANAMVPFYGQGMNCGLESVRVLFETLDRHASDKDYTAALDSYTKFRAPDAHAVADLALNNYIEMRSSVTSPLYKLRKFIEERLYKFAPGLGWATQYSRVSFSNMRYSEVINRSAHQKKVLQSIVGALGVGAGAVVVYLALTVAKRRRLMRM